MKKYISIIKDLSKANEMLASDLEEQIKAYEAEKASSDLWYRLNGEKEKRIADLVKYIAASEEERKQWKAQAEGKTVIDPRD